MRELERIDAEKVKNSPAGSSDEVVEREILDLEVDPEPPR
jgi:hypothetical protein